MIYSLLQSVSSFKNYRWRGAHHLHLLFCKKCVNKIIKRGELKNMKNRVISRTEQKWDFVASPLFHSLAAPHTEKSCESEPLASYSNYCRLHMLQRNRETIFLKVMVSDFGDQTCAKSRRSGRGYIQNLS